MLPGMGGNGGESNERTYRGQTERLPVLLFLEADRGLHLLRQNRMLLLYFSAEAVCRCTHVRQVPTFDLYMAYEKKAVVTVNGKSYLTGSAIVFYCLDDELWDVSSGDADLVWQLFEERTEQLRHGDETLPAIAL